MAEPVKGGTHTSSPLRKGEAESPQGSFRVFSLLCSMHKQHVSVLLVNGSEWTGQLHGVSSKHGLVIYLKNARTDKSDVLVRNYIVHFKDMVTISLDLGRMKGKTGYSRDDAQNSSMFRTDGEISGAGNSNRFRTRELVRWSHGEEDHDMITLDEEVVSSGHRWDQFEENKRKFGVKSSFDENLYTTKLENVSKEERQKADRIAREIMGKAEYQSPRAKHDREESWRDRPARNKRSSKRTRGRGEGRHQKNKQNDKTVEEKDERPWSDVKGPTPVPVSGEILSPREVPLEVGEDVTEKELNEELTRERLRVRMSLASPSSAEYTEDGPRSPLHSPIVGNPEEISALDLCPSLPKVSDDAIMGFVGFKLKDKKSESPRKELEDHKQFSSEFRIPTHFPMSRLARSVSPGNSGGTLFPKVEPNESGAGGKPRKVSYGLRHSESAGSIIDMKKAAERLEKQEGEKKKRITVGVDEPKLIDKAEVVNTSAEGDKGSDSESFKFNVGASEFIPSFMKERTPPPPQAGPYTQRGGFIPESSYTMQPIVQPDGNGMGHQGPTPYDGQYPIQSVMSPPPFYGPGGQVIPPQFAPGYSGQPPQFAIGVAQDPRMYPSQIGRPQPMMSPPQMMMDPRGMGMKTNTIPQKNPAGQNAKQDVQKKDEN